MYFLAKAGIAKTSLARNVKMIKVKTVSVNVFYILILMNFLFVTLSLSKCDYTKFMSGFDGLNLTFGFKMPDRSPALQNLW